MAIKQEVKIQGRSIPVSNIDKVLFPAMGFTKGQVIEYYVRVAKFLLPHLKDRPVTLKRYPDGVLGEHFYEKNAPRFTPEWVATYPVARQGERSEIDYILINDAATLVWCANLANLEIHPFLHRVPEIDRPTQIVFDLDPGEGVDILKCTEVSFLLKDLLERLKLQAFPKVSGSKGMQIHVPLNTAVNYDVTQPFARTVAEWLEREHPKLVVSEMGKTARSGKVFIDWSQNAAHKTTISVYSLRAKHARPFVAMPVTWEELRKALENRDASGLSFEPAEALSRLKKLKDLFAPVLTLEQELPAKFVSSLKTGTPARKPGGKALEDYRKKRDFKKTPEPPPAVPRSSRQGSRRRFVIQKHAASHLHYDFRLEMHGVLKSWAVPKGIPYDLREKRLAMETEDHPIAYLDFEGIIPQGQYGGGTVMVWDIGTYEVMDGSYYQDKLHLYLEGRKLSGEWVLVKIRKAERNSWLLIKAGERMKPLSAREDDISAITGRRMAEIAAAGDAVWESR